MRCLACDAGLTEEQARKKMPVCQEYWDLCATCLRAVGVGKQVAGPTISLTEPTRLVEIADQLLEQRGFNKWGRRPLEET